MNLIKFMLNTRTRLFLFAFLNGAAVFLRRLRLSAPTNQKIGSGSVAALKWRLRLRNT